MREKNEMNTGMKAAELSPDELAQVNGGVSVDLDNNTTLFWCKNDTLAELNTYCGYYRDMSAMEELRQKATELGWPGGVTNAVCWGWVRLSRNGSLSFHTF